ncbi:hypothetical protein IE53DRAFT_370801 [Violaceomyces palustris]|uniref:Uncharacterized protein n=1 Tax=Violaceomyces palustris TaxID=1673888 RepID=A0ACD0NQY0_9BASI|nr:hypothetical protein IE53DRAFT_370801 [Violaceomyces palustris]
MTGQANVSILPHLAHALARISKVQPRTIVSPPTQPRRASVAILVRVRPTPEDEAWLAKNLDPEDQQGISSPPSTSTPQQPAAINFGFGNSGRPGTQDPLENSAVSEGMMANSGVHLSKASLPGRSSSQEGGSASGRSSLGSSNQAADQDVVSVLSGFFSQPWVKRGTPEILYIKRAARQGDKWSSHVAFPGGRKEEGDENGLYTAMRETWEEVGIDLAEKEFQCVGQLDDREITTSLGKRLLMVLSPFVFVQTSPFSPLPDLQPSEVASAHWIPLSLLYTPTPKWGAMSIDISSRLAPKSPFVRWCLRALVGKMDFKCIRLPNEPVAIAEFEEDEDQEALIGARVAREEQLVGEKQELRLWGLTLGMTLDLLSHMTTYPLSSTNSAGPISPLRASSPTWHIDPTSPSTSSRGPSSDKLTSNVQSSRVAPSPLGSISKIINMIRDECHLDPPPLANALAPSLTSVFPRFSYPDVNFWIWVFGWRYRNVVRGWQNNIGTSLERRVNWSGMALGAFYSAVRRALVVAIVLRALGLFSTATLVGWLAGRKIRRARNGLPGLGLEEIFSSLRD